MSFDVNQFAVLNAPGAVAQSPQLPTGFIEVFSSRVVVAGGLRQHAVIGGNGPGLLLVHGWPQSWYAWRHMMPVLAKTHTVIAVDQRGMGLTSKPEDGYDAGTLAGDLAALMYELGHDRFAVVGHDTGMVIGYALAADHPELIDRLVVAELPAPLTGIQSSPLDLPKSLIDRLWHMPFARAGIVAEQLIRGREDIFLSYVFAVQGGPALPLEVVEYYIRNFAADRALRGGLGFYRDWDTTVLQNVKRGTRPLRMPVLAVGGDDGWAEHVGLSMQPAANTVQTVVIPDAGHWIPEQAPDDFLTALTGFLNKRPLR